MSRIGIPFYPPFNDAQTSVGRAERGGQPQLVVLPLLVGRKYRYDGVHDDALVVHCSAGRGLPGPDGKRDGHARPDDV